MLMLLFILFIDFIHCRVYRTIIIILYLILKDVWWIVVLICVLTIRYALPTTIGRYWWSSFLVTNWFYLDVNNWVIILLSLLLAVIRGCPCTWVRVPFLPFLFTENEAILSIRNMFFSLINGLNEVLFLKLLFNFNVLHLTFFQIMFKLINVLFQLLYLSFCLWWILIGVLFCSIL